MENNNFKKLLAVACVIPVLALGYQLMPDSNDVRENVYGRSISVFLSGFYKADKVEKSFPLPDVEIISQENRTVNLRSLVKGRITLVNFWASWCAPCLKEMPELAKFQQANPNILIVPISLDMQKTLPELATLFNNPAMRDIRWFYDAKGDLRKNLKLEAYPTTYVLDRKGEVVYILQGPADWASHDASSFAKALSQRY